MKGHYSWTRPLPNGLVLNLATLGPIGSLKAPGTWGSVVGIGWYAAFFVSSPPLFALILAFATAFIAIAICGEAEVRLQKRDPGEIILDEIVAVPFCFIAIPIQEYKSPWLIALAGFAIFRFFDILKPIGIKRLQNLEGGAGVVMDDIAAGLATCVVLHVALAFV